jgi:hypothetical protein
MRLESAPMRQFYFTTKDTKSTKCGIFILRTFVSFVIFVVRLDFTSRISTSNRYLLNPCRRAGLSTKIFCSNAASPST